MSKNTKNARPSNSRNAEVEIIKPLTKGSKAKVVTGKKATAPKKNVKKAVDQGRTFEGSAVRQQAHERVKELGIAKKRNEATEKLAKAAMAAKREYYGAKASEAGTKAVAAAAEALDTAVAKFGKAIGIPDLSINLAKDIARDWKCFDGK